ncbi:MAG: hypothetical protein ACI3Y4_04610 [Candidatus Cryptobacteroides sp.]
MRTTAKRERKPVLFRFDEDLYNNIKYRAKVNKQSLNSYVEDILNREIHKKDSLPEFSLPEGIAPELEELCGILKEYRIEDKDFEEAKYDYIISK